MWANAIFLFSILVATACFAADLPQFYVDAKKMWMKNKAGKEYQTYADEFSKFNNRFHIDENGDCYRLSPESIELMLVITNSKDEEFAVIERVISDKDNLKAQCFKKTYTGIRTKIPPYLPFVLQMRMG